MSNGTDDSATQAVEYLRHPSYRDGRFDSPIRFYVSPDGSDRATGQSMEVGSDDGPFATVQRAQRTIRALKERGGLDLPIVVTIAGGEYFLDKPILFRDRDAGTALCPIIYAAAEGERPVFSGGRLVKNIKEGRHRRRRAWFAEVPWVKTEDRKFRQLFVNGRRGSRTRWPREGYLRVRGLPEMSGPKLERLKKKNPGFWSHLQGNQCLEYKRGDIKNWKNLSDIDAVVITGWVINRLPIKRLDKEKRIVWFDRPSEWMFYHEHSGKGTVFSDYWIENVFELLDSPGQWYLDRMNGKLTYLPREDEAIEDARIVMPYLSHLLEIKGTQNRPVGHLHFIGLDFSHTDYEYPPHLAASSCAAETPGTISVTNAESCIFHRCSVTNIGAYGIDIVRGCRDLEISHCQIRDMGAGGIKIEGEGAGHPGYKKNGTPCSRITIMDNEIADGGHIFMEGAGVMIGNSPGNRVLHNHIHDLYYSGIVLSGVCGYLPPALTTGNIIEWNTIHDIGQGQISDLAGIYANGVSTGSRIRYNVVHDVKHRIYGGHGIYLDSGATHYLVEKNLAYRCSTCPYMQNYGTENEVINNIWAFGEMAQIHRGSLEHQISFVLKRNILYFSGEVNVLRGRWHDKTAIFVTMSQFEWSQEGRPTIEYKSELNNCDLEQNLYYNASGDPVMFMDKTFEEWQALGYDKGSIIANPLFRDPDNGDFGLPARSPARKIGFEPWDIDNAGPRALPESCTC